MGLTGENGLKTMQYVISVFSAKFTPKPVGFTGKNKSVGFLNSNANCGVFFLLFIPLRAPDQENPKLVHLKLAFYHHSSKVRKERND